MTLPAFVLPTILLVVGTARLKQDWMTSARIGRDELKGALAPLLTGAAAVLFIAWPLLYHGHAAYWGFANPDQPFYMTILKYLHTHSFGVPQGTAGGDRTVVIGLSYFLSMLNVLTGIPVELLFGVACAGVLFLIPPSLCLLAEFGFGMPRGTSLVSGLLLAVSSVLAQTFYLHSLGALTVIALLPIGMALAIHYTRSTSLKNAMLLALAITGMFYCYYPGFGVLGIAIGSVMISGLIRRAISLRAAIIPALLAAGLMLLVFLPQAGAILTRLLTETVSSRLAVSPSSDEVQLSFALVLTEEVVPFIWGFSHLDSPALLPGSPNLAFFTLFTLGCLLLALLLLSTIGRLSRLGNDYVVPVVALLAITCIYIAGDNAYGVFKLIAWIQPLLLLGLTATCMGMARAMARGRLRMLAVLPPMLLLGQAGLNLVRTAQAGQFTSRSAPGSMHNLPSYSLRSFRSLAEIPDAFGREGMIVGLADPVVQRWASAFLEMEDVPFAPVLTLNVEDSDSATSQRYLTSSMKGLDSKYLLHWAESAADIVSPPAAAPVWSNGTFSLTPWMAARNTLLLGAGWYRKEQYPEAGLAWLQRFRWMRRRAEAILLNPSTGPHRLALTVVAGYGNPSVTRSLVLWVNGQKLEEIKVTGYARLLSRPFVAIAPWTHLELEVEEAAHLVPRPHGLWNTWIPRDPRRLNIAVSEFALVPDNGEAADLSTTMDLTSQASFRHVLFDGIFPDRWVGNKAMVELGLPHGATAIELVGMVPGVPTLPFPYRIRAVVNGTSVGEQSIPHPGAFQLRFSLKEVMATNDVGKATIVVEPAATFLGAQLGMSEDHRPLSILLDHIGVISE
ncbi:MAG: hypothetical protein HY722_09155 [Planctomycetes bacterium]|nr:hypothetical protein [Planctomycetota bacterium]